MASGQDPLSVPSRNALTDPTNEGTPSEGIPALPWVRWFNAVRQAIINSQGASGSTVGDVPFEQGFSRASVPSQRVVTSLNGQQGDVTITGSDMAALVDSALLKVPLPSQRVITSLDGAQGDVFVPNVDPAVQAALAKVPLPPQRVVTSVNGQQGDVTVTGAVTSIDTQTGAIVIPQVDAAVQAALAKVPAPSQGVVRSLNGQQGDIVLPSGRTNVTGSRSIGTGGIGSIYQNTGLNPIFVNIVVQTNSALANGIVALCDPFSPPTTLVSAFNWVVTTGDYVTLSFIVLPGEYYACWASLATISMTWMEWQ